VPRHIEEALNEIIKTTDKSGDTKKELKKTIYENVSTLRKLFVKMKEKLEEGNRRKEKLDKETNDQKRELESCKKVINNTCTVYKRETST